MIEKLGFYIGNDMNLQKDNRLFSYLFINRHAWQSSNEYLFELSRIFYNKMRFGNIAAYKNERIIEALKYVERPIFLKEWPRLRHRLLKLTNSAPELNTPWGWKEPNSHLFIDRIARFFPGLKYIHVMRHGVDMAFSQNQFQLQRWGQLVLNENIEINPQYSLKYWCVVHKRLEKIQQELAGRFYLISFDLLCESPAQEISKLLKFLNIKQDDKLIDFLIPLVSKPNSIGRHRNEDLSIFDKGDLQFVEQMGYDILSP